MDARVYDRADVSKSRKAWSGIDTPIYPQVSVSLDDKASTTCWWDELVGQPLNRGRAEGRNTYPSAIPEQAGRGDGAYRAVNANTSGYGGQPPCGVCGGEQF